MVNGRFDAAITSCVVAGAMAWVSFVDCAVFSKLARSGESKALTKIFSAWWPAGKAFMMPALGCAVGSQVWAYVETERNKLYLLSAGSLVSIGLWTRAIMWDDINHLLAATGGGGDTCKTALDFVRLHHARLGFAVVGAVSSTYASVFHH